MKKIFVYLFALIIITSCNNESKKAPLVQNDSSKTDTNSYVTEKFRVKPKNVEKIDTIKIDYHDFNLSLPNFIVFDADSISKRDTAQISVDLDSDLQNQKIIIKPLNNISSVEIFESYRIILSVQEEGPHLDLYDWKYYESDWQKIDKVDDYTFTTLKIPENTNDKFPKFTKEELIKYVLKTSSDSSFAEVLKHPDDGNWKNNIAIGVGLIRLKIVYLDINGVSKTKLLIAFLPMGC